MPSKRDWFAVDAEGFAALQRGREPWKLVKELVANAWDEEITICEVEIGVPGTASSGEHPVDVKPVARTGLVVMDDSPTGFADLRDANTFFRRNDKRCRPDVRGRFNLGEKEILSIARWARVLTMSGCVEFCTDGSIRRPRVKRGLGTEVKLALTWTAEERHNVADALQRFLPPEGKALVVNGVEVLYRAPEHVVECTLPTVLEDEDGLRPTARKTTVHVHESCDVLAAGALERLAHGKSAVPAEGKPRGWLYEMGIPVCEIDAPYLVDVQQKIPLSTDRDTVPPAFLRDIYAEVLNVVAEKLDREVVSDTWVREATEDERAEPSAVRAVAKKRWGDRAVMWSSDPRANQDATDHGYDVVHPRTMSAAEREAFRGAGKLKPASMVFPQIGKDVESIDRSEWTPRMHEIADLTRRLAVALLDFDVDVRFIRDREISAGGSYGARTVTFNLAKLTSDWHLETRAIGAGHYDLILHELAHERGFMHDTKYVDTLGSLAGRAVRLALEDPGLFKK